MVVNTLRDMADVIFDSQPTEARRLSNGLTVVVREVQDAPIVAIVTRVAAGYFDESDDEVGISHVLEHMYFKGTSRRAPGEIARETKALGGYLNAGTIYDHTSYYTVLPADALEAGLDIQSDALRDSRIDAEQLERELRVIVQEASRKLDNPAAFARESLYATMFDRHRMRRWRIGTAERLRALTRAQVDAFYRRHYVPARIHLVVAGGVRADAALALVDRHYGDMPAATGARDTGPREPTRARFRLREVTGDVVQTRIELGWRSQGPLHEDTAALDLLAVVLGQGRASRLYREVRDAGLANAVQAYNYTPGEIGVFGVGAEVDPTLAHDALGALAGSVNALAEQVPESEVERAKRVTEARWLRRIERVEGQANMLADWQALGDWRLAEAHLARVRASTHTDLARVAATYLSPERASVFVYRPEEAEAFGPGAARAAFSTRRSRVGTARAGFGSGGFVPAESRPAPALIGSRAAGDTAHVRLHVVGDETRVVIKPRPGSGLVAMSVCYEGGRRAEHAARAGITALMSRSSIRGTTRRSAAQLAAETESLGGVMSPSVLSDMFEWRVSLPSRHFNAGLDLLLDPVLEPSFREDEIDREREIALNALDDLRDDMQRYPVHLCLAAAFGGHPYGFTIEQSAAGLRAADAAAIRAWHEDVVLRARPTLFVVGDVDPDDVLRIVDPYLARLGEGGGSAVRSAPSWPHEPRQETVERSRAQTALALAFPGPDRNAPDALAMRVLANAISGLGGRLFEDLRSERGLAYVVLTQPLARLDAGAFIAYIATAPERADEARDRLLRVLLAVRDERLETHEIERAQRFMIGVRQSRCQTNDAQLTELTEAILLGPGLAEVSDFEQDVSAVTPERVRAAAARWLDERRAVQGTVVGVEG